MFHITKIHFVSMSQPIQTSIFPSAKYNKNELEGKYWFIFFFSN